MVSHYRRHFLYGFSVLALLSILLVVKTFYCYDGTPTLVHIYFPKERNDAHPYQNKKKVSCSLGCHFISTSPIMIFSEVFYLSSSFLRICQNIIQTPPSCPHVSFETYHRLKDLHHTMSFKML